LNLKRDQRVFNKMTDVISERPPGFPVVVPFTHWRTIMDKTRFIAAAILAAAVALPSIASAETVVIKKDHDHFHNARAQYHRDWHPHHDKVVVVKRNHHWD
jgi:hypothetical protein